MNFLQSLEVVSKKTSDYLSPSLSMFDKEKEGEKGGEQRGDFTNIPSPIKWGHKFFIDKTDHPPTIVVPEKNEYTSKDLQKYLTLVGNMKYNPWLILLFDIILGTMDDPENNKLNRKTTTYLNRFFRYEKLIRNDELFWGCAYKVWYFGGSPDERWLIAFKRYGRLKLPLEDRFRVFQHLTDRRRTTRPIHGAYLSAMLQDYGDDDYIPIYRGFHIRKGKSARKGAKKVGNENAFFQDEGKGFSYSLSSTYATKITTGHFNPYFYEKYGGITDKKIIQKQLENHVAGYSHIKSDVADTDYYSALGTFGVKKRHVINLILDQQEEEIICDPKHVHFVRYDFLTWSKCVTASTIFSMKSSMYHKILEKVGDDQPVLCFMHAGDEENLVSQCDEHIKKMYNEPELMEEYIQQGQPKDYPPFDKFFKEMQDVVELTAVELTNSDGVEIPVSLLCTEEFKNKVHDVCERGGSLSFPKLKTEK